METGKPLTPKPYPLDQNGYTEDLNTSTHIEASVEKALDNRQVPDLLKSIISELKDVNTKLDTLNTRVNTTNSTLGTISGNVSDIEKILDDHYNPES